MGNALKFCSSPEPTACHLHVCNILETTRCRHTTYILAICVQHCMQCFSGFLSFDSVGCGVVVPEVLVRVLDFVVRYKGGNFIGPLAERALVYTYVLVCAEDSVPIK